jgi:hypothetical protein
VVSRSARVFTVPLLYREPPVPASRSPASAICARISPRRMSDSTAMAPASDRLRMVTGWWTAAEGYAAERRRPSSRSSLPSGAR